MNALRSDRLSGQALWSPVADTTIDFIAQYLESYPAPASAAVPKLPLKSFVHRLVYRAKLTTSVLVTSMIYLRRFRSCVEKQANSSPELCKELVFISSVISATKFLEDHPLTTFKMVNILRERWNSAEINEAEKEFLEVLRFRLWIDWSELEEFIRSNQLDCPVGSSM